MSLSYLNKKFSEEINFSVIFAYNISNRIKIVKTKYVDKLLQLKLLEKDLQILQRRYNEMSQTYSSIQDYMYERNPMLDPYDLRHVCKRLRQLYNLIQIVTKSYFIMTFHLWSC